MSSKVFHLNSLADLPSAALWLQENLGVDQHISFVGEMGSGKTTLIQAFCRLLGVKTEVTSPTFALVNEYQARENLRIFHFDFYRLNDPVEALDFGVEEYFAGDGLCLMEWAELISPFLPDDIRRVFIDVESDGSRLLRLV